MQRKIKCEFCKCDNKKILPLYFDGLKKNTCCECAVKKLGEGYKITYDLFPFELMTIYERNA